MYYKLHFSCSNAALMKISVKHLFRVLICFLLSPKQTESRFCRCIYSKFKCCRVTPSRPNSTNVAAEFLRDCSSDTPSEGSSISEELRGFSAMKNDNALRGNGSLSGNAVRVARIVEVPREVDCM